MSIKKVDFQQKREYVSKEELSALFPDNVLETIVLVKTPDGWLVGNTELHNAHEVVGMLQVAAHDLIDAIREIAYE